MRMLTYPRRNTIGQLRKWTTKPARNDFCCRECFTSRRCFQVRFGRAAAQEPANK